MSPRQTSPRRPPPRLWLFTDERAAAGLETALARLPRGSGIVFRHYVTPPRERRALYERVRAIARRRRLVLVLGGTPREAIGWRADGAHGASPHRRAARVLVRTMPVHDRAELMRACRGGAELAFLSPVFATRSHPGARVLGRVRFGLIARSTAMRVAALGGIDRDGFRALARLAYGWGAIDEWSRGGGTPDQKRKVVPR